MWICFKEDIPEPPVLVIIGDDTIERVKLFELLGMWWTNSLKWNKHVEEITKKANKLTLIPPSGMPPSQFTARGWINV